MTATRIRPSDLTIRRVTRADEDLLNDFIGSERIQEMQSSGFSDEEASGVTPDAIVELVDQWLMRGWMVDLPGQGPVSLQLYAPTGVPGIWSGECINRRASDGSKGLGTAAMALAMDQLFSESDVHRLTGHVAITNEPSLAMCRRLGFTCEGRAREHLPSGPGTWMDAWIMGILKRDWKGSAAIEESLR